VHPSRNKLVLSARTFVTGTLPRGRERERERWKAAGKISNFKPTKFHAREIQRNRDVAPSLPSVLPHHCEVFSGIRWRCSHAPARRRVSGRCSQVDRDGYSPPESLDRESTAREEHLSRNVAAVRKFFPGAPFNPRGENKGREGKPAAGLKRTSPPKREREGEREKESGEDSERVRSRARCR